MVCPACGADNLDTAQSCASCGSHLVAPHLPMGNKLMGGRYTIGKVLGEGGFGITYQGADTLLKRPVAIKELFPEGARRSGSTVIPPVSTGEDSFIEIRQDFIKEAQTLAQFSHPSIVRVLDQFETNDTAYFVMEFLKGETLANRIAHEGKMAFPEVYQIAEQVAEALGLVHQIGLLHRDIKPENILLTEDKRAVLIDFGSARQFMLNKTTKITRMVTPGYAPLEQYASQARFGAYTDIYALGATLYHALEGKCPVEATDRLAGQSLPPLSEELPEGLHNAIDKALGLRIEIRPQTTEIFLDILREGSQESLIQPYFFKGKKYATPQKLAYGLVNDWSNALAEITSENLRKWLFREARDLDLGIFLEDLVQANEDNDLKLFKLINRLNSQVINYQGYAIADKVDLLNLALAAKQDSRAQEAVMNILDKGVLALHPQAQQQGFLLLEQTWVSEIQSYYKLLKKGEQENFPVPAPYKNAETVLLTALLSQSAANDLQFKARQASSKKAMRRPWFKQIPQKTSAEQLAVLSLAFLASNQTTDIQIKNRLRGALAAAVTWEALYLLNINLFNVNFRSILTVVLGIFVGAIFGFVLHSLPDIKKGPRLWWKLVTLPILGGISVLLFNSPYIYTALNVEISYAFLVLLIIFLVIGVTC